MPHHGAGPIPARIMLVGEAWGDEEERLGQPFMGASGQELNRMLQQVGILRSDCYVTNLVNRRPPQNDLGAWIAMKKSHVTSKHVPLRDHMVLPVVVEGYQQLLAEIKMVQPNLIIAFGGWALWALTGNSGIRNWRGSLLSADIGEEQPPKVIPTIHPTSVLREWSQRASAVSDLRRAAKHMHSRTYTPPVWNFAIRPSFEQVRLVITGLLARMGQEDIWLDLDIETSSGHIACLGFSWSLTDTLTIPFMCRENREGYWSLEEEAAIVWMLYRLFTHPRAHIRWQNGLYDAQYIWRHWLFLPRGRQDTMISQHAMFSDLPKSLAYQASIYADHYVFWKDEGKQLAKGGSEDQHWRYNSLDCIYTREVGEAELKMVKDFSAGKWPAAEAIHEFQQAMFWPVLRAMTRGVKIDLKARDQLSMEIQDQISAREALLARVLGHTLNAKSPLQMQKLFYEDLGQPPIKTRGKKGVPGHVTCDDEALQKIASREPLLKPIINCISDVRTLNIFLSNFVLARLDQDNRMRCSYNIGGSESGKSAPKTYRLSSSKNAFGGGTNLQNIPSEKSKSVGKAAARGGISFLGDPYSLPNVRGLFIPDTGFDFFDMDLDRADLQVVVWEADDEMLKAALRQGADIHLLNAYVLAGKEPPPLEELVESHPRYPDHRGPLKLKREFAKVFCHATNYVGSARTVAGHLGQLISEVERAQKLWFGAHPGIKKWHLRVEEQINKYRFVENRFGYRWYIFDRLDMILPEAVAWIPQSTVSIVINRIWMSLYQGKPEGEWDLSPDNMLRLFHQPAQGIEVLLQVHDSLAGQFPSHRKDFCLAEMKRLSSITIPYEDPLIIPTGVGTSNKTWGAC